MARASSARASDAPRDAIALLKQDHRLVEQLFSQFQKAEEDAQSEIAEQVCNMLTVHTQIEEEILYPAAREALADDDEEAELVPEAQIEHDSAKDLIAKIEGMTPDDESFKAAMTVLSEYVKHHVKEEESEMFPALRRSELDLKELGAQLADRKFALMEEMGVEEPEPPQARKRSSSARSKSSSSKSRQARAGARSKSSRSSSGRAARH